VKIGIIGAAAPTKGYLPQIGVELGRKLRVYLGDKGFVFTGGVSGVGVDVYQGVVEASNGEEDRFFILLPEGMFAGRDYGDISPNGQVKTAHFGDDMFERRIGMGKVADALIVLNGRAGTLHEAVSALENNRKVIALNYGGAGSLLYHAKINGIVPALLVKKGVKQEYLDNIIATDITGIEEALDSLTGFVHSEEAKALEGIVKAEEAEKATQQQIQLSLFEQDNTDVDNLVQLDYFGKYAFTVDKDGNMFLSPEAVSAINSLSQAYDGITLEIDTDTLVDTSKGTPQLKGIGFKEAVASLYQAKEKKEIPENIHIRLININPSLNKEQIIKVLGLTDDLLESLVTIPDIPQDYVIKTLEPYLIAGSIRIIFEDNVRYWGKKVDVLVKRGKETQTMSSLGLIVAALAKEPKFYQELPQDVKDYIVAVTDEKGGIALDEQNKIKQLIFKPIEKEKLNTEYIEELNRANKVLEGMV